MSKVSAKPSGRKIVLAFLLAPLAGSLMFVGLMMASSGETDFGFLIVGALFGCLYFAYPVTLLFGVPALMILKDRARPTALNCGLTGAAVASLPVLFIAGLFALSKLAGKDGDVTLDDVANFAKWMVPVAASGFAGGFAFWLVAAAGPASRSDGRRRRPSSPPSDPA